MTDLNIHNWATTLIETHKKPLKYLEVISNKSLLSTKSEEELALIDIHLKNIFEASSRDRVERRCVRAVGCWLPVEKLVEVKKVCGLINNFGFANRNGKYLYPEEAMFLLETNRLEILWNNVPMSIQQAYQVIIDEDIHKYLLYRKLSLEGFRLLKPPVDIGEPSKKKLCVLPENEKHVDCNLKLLQDSGPQSYHSADVKDKFDYKIYIPEHSNKDIEDFKLHIM
ncbi:hypothetical protein RI129_009915 [Pyrocoelia pectoralis]|uniref:tRNA-splicing endonuclease subunit Sen54 N-terminal domain-containing protein n=1 Tax=Pyrocoelia pectoralis TaxID=417401 RepID=A0AAN7V707_9COLE